MNKNYYIINIILSFKSTNISYIKIHMNFFLVINSVIHIINYNCISFIIYIYRCIFQIEMNQYIDTLSTIDYSIHSRYVSITHPQYIITPILIMYN